MNGTLILVRHGESLWNARNVWTGLTDIELSDRGKQEAVQAAKQISNNNISRAFTSELSRAAQTLSIILDTLGYSHVPVTKNAALNERDYGIYTGKNKTEVKQELGESGYIALRRGWDTPVPQGENLKQVYERVVPYYEQVILPFLIAGECVLVVAHGNSLRALIKFLDNISDTDIEKVELKTGELMLYEVGVNGHVNSRQKKDVNKEI